MSSAPPPGTGEQRKEPPSNLATAIAEVSEHASILVREEIELAKAEINEKAVKLAKGAFVGVVAGIFFAVALLFVLIGFAWLLYYVLPGNDFTYFWGFFAMAVILVILGAIAGLIAARVVKKLAAGARNGDRRGTQNPRRPSAHLRGGAAVRAHASGGCAGCTGRPRTARSAAAHLAARCSARARRGGRARGARARESTGRHPRR